MSTLATAMLGRFPDPFITQTSARTPRTVNEIFHWAEAAWNRNGTLSRACKRVSRFFITKILYSGIDDEETELWKEFHAESGISQELALAGDDKQCYGNYFGVIYQPFFRFLACPKCGLTRLISEWDYRFRDLKFFPNRGCPGNKSSGMNGRCQYTGELRRIERASTDEKNFKVIRLSPYQMRIEHNLFSRTSRYIYRIPQPVIRGIRECAPIYLDYTPWELIVAAHENRPFAFRPGVVFHMKNDTLAGIHNMGWGISEIMMNLGLIDRVQVLNMHDEAIALDYIIPLRVIAPPFATGQTGDPIKTMNLGGSFVPNVSRMIRRRRLDPAAWNVLPFPIDYKVYGGEGREMSPVELKSMAMDELLNASGVPADLYRAQLDTQGAPLAIRLFTQSWGHLINDYTSFLNWHAQTISDALRWDKPKLEMQFPTIADDIEKKQIQMSLAAANKISMASALEPLGLDPKRELERRFEEMRMELAEQKKFEDAVANSRAQGDLSPTPSATAGMGGAGGGQSAGGFAGGGGGQITLGGSPRDVQEQALTLAQEIVSNPSLAQRRQRLSQIRQSSETLHALVKSHMENIRSQASSAGRQQLVG